MKPNSIRSNSLWNVVGNGVYAACQWALVVVLAKLSSPETVGAFALGVAIAVPTVMLTNLQLRAVQATDAVDDFSFGSYVGLRLTCGAVAFLFIVVVSLLFVDPRYTVVVILIGVGRLVESISDVLYGLMQKRERMEMIAKSLIVRAPLGLALFAGGYALSARLDVALAGYIVGSTLGLVLLDIPFSRKLTAEGQRWVVFEKDATLRLLKLSFPLGVVVMLVALNQHVPRYAIAGGVGDFGLGVFTAVVYLALAAAPLVNALCQAVTPRLARAYADGDVAFVRSTLVKLLGASAGIALAGLAIALLVGSLLLRTVYSVEYQPYGSLLAAAMAVGLPVYLATCLGHTLTAMREFRVQLPLLASVTLATLVTATAAVPHYGIAGGVAALAAGAVVQTLGSAWIVGARLRSAQVQGAFASSPLAQDTVG